MDAATTDADAAVDDVAAAGTIGKTGFDGSEGSDDRLALVTEDSGG